MLARGDDVRDIRLVEDGGFFDLEVKGDDLAGEDGLDSAAVLSLFTEGEGLGSRGYWADALAAAPGDRWGSTLRRSVGAPNTQARRVALLRSIEASMAWAIEDAVATDVAVEATGYSRGRLDVDVELVGAGAGRRWSIYWDVHRGRAGLASDAA